MEQYFSPTIFQHKPNFNISKQGVYCYECSGVNVLAKVPRDTEKGDSTLGMNSATDVVDLQRLDKPCSSLFDGEVDELTRMGFVY